MSTEGKRIFMIALLASFIVPYTGSSVNVALPSLGRELDMNTLQLSWVQLAFLLAAAMFMLPIGRMGDLIGRRKVLMSGTTLYILMSVLCSLSESAGVLILARVFQGVGGAAVSVSVVAMISTAFPPGERGRVLGLTAAATYIGLSVGPFLGGLLTSAWGWRSVFWIIVPVCLAMLFLSLGLKPESRQDGGKRFDLAGAAVYGAGLLALMVGLTQVNRMNGLLLLVGGLTALWGFARIENRVANPMLDMKLLGQNPVMLFSSLAALINYCATYSVGYLLSLDLQVVMGYSPRVTGLVLVAQPVIQALVSPVAGRLSDQYDAGTVASMGMGITTAALVIFAVMPPGNVPLIIAVLGLLGLGLALFVSPNTNAIMNAVEPPHYGAASGLLGTARSVGQAFSMGVTALIMTLTMGDARMTEANQALFLSSFRISFVVMAALCFAGVFASMARNRTRSLQ